MVAAALRPAWWIRASGCAQPTLEDVVCRLGGGGGMARTGTKDRLGLDEGDATASGPRAARSLATDGCRPDDELEPSLVRSWTRATDAWFIGAQLDSASDGC